MHYHLTKSDLLKRVQALEKATGIKPEAPAKPKTRKVKIK